MAITGIFTKRQPSVGGLVFDALLEESDELQTDVTAYAIEDGSIAQDHAVTQAQTFSLLVAITDNPIRSLAAQASQQDVLTSLADTGLSSGAISAIASGAAGLGVGSVIGSLGGSGAALAGLGASIANAAYASGQASSRSGTALENIRALQRKKEVFTLTTSKGTYDNCIITNTRRRTDPSNEQGLELVIDIMQLRRITSRRVTLLTEGPPVQGDDTAATQAQPETRGGRVTVELIN